MMTVQMNNRPAPSSREFAETLHQKNIELEKSLRKSAQSKIPSNPSTWLEMRENFEGIILADHDFAQKNDTETALWQLHYRRIEEFRAHIKSASSLSAQTQGGTKTNPNPNPNPNTDRVKRIKSSFKVFLSESTGYYHELMLKIRSNYGLPLGYFSEGPECKIDPAKDEKEMKKGLYSCHKCLIYLGDLARYKGLYGEGDSIEREFKAANSYYLQAVELFPSSGNPHHQLGLLANYSNNELLLVYRYFRSLAVEFPFTMARENLVVAFEKNRQQYIQLATNNTVSKATNNNTRAGSTRPGGKFRGKGENKSSSKETKTEQVSNKETEITLPEVFKSFCVRFVRLNGILFTRTSLETFDEVFSSSITDLKTLLSSGQEEQLNFGSDFTENALLILRLIAMLIFTIHNSKRDSENQSYAEIVQRALILKNAFKFSFEFVGFIIKRCSEVKDISSSFYLNGILVYLEWLACHMEIASGTGTSTGTGTEIDEKQNNARSFFWNQFVILMNKLVRTGLASFEGDNDLSCFYEMSNYEEGETGNRLALWEDFELRGFVPLVPAQVILDFSRKSDLGLKEKKFRVERIFAAGRALMNLVQIGNNKIYFDQGDGKFVICKDPPEFLPPSQIGPEIVPNGVQGENHVNDQINHINININSFDEEDDDEEIVFQPNINAEKSPPNLNNDDFVINNMVPNHNNDYSNLNNDDFIDRNIQMSGAGWINTINVPISKQSQEHGIIIQDNSAKMPQVNNWASFDQEAFLKNFTIAENGILEQRNNFMIPENGRNNFPIAENGRNNLPIAENGRNNLPILENGRNNFSIAENGIMDQRNNFSIAENGILEQRLQRIPFPSHIPPPPPGYNNNHINNNNNIISNGYMHQIPFSSSVITSNTNNMNMLTSSAMSAGMKLDFGAPSKKNPNPVSRPVRHVGPPPGFSAPMKRLDETLNYPNNTNPSHLDEFGYLNNVQGGTSSNQLGYNNFMNFGYNNAASSVPVSGTQVKDFQLFESSEMNNNGGNVNNNIINVNNNGQQEKLQNSLWSGHYFV